MTYTIIAIILAIIEGITEFLPISSTGHMIIASSLMGVANDPFVKMLTIAIQFGAIMSVVVIYWKIFFTDFDIYKKLFIAFLPAVFFGLLLKKYIDLLLENVLVVAVSLVLGGIILLFIDKIFAKNEKSNKNEKISNKNSLIIGVFQCISMIPGVSRSAATIIGGLTQNFNRKQAAEFSFLLAVPTMLAATVKELWDFRDNFKEDMILPFAVGNIIAFIVALLSIKIFIGYLTKKGFKIFGWYRIIVGSIILILLFLGYDLKMI